YYKCLEQLTKTKQLPEEDPLEIQIVRDSFEKVTTVSNEIFKISPEDYLYSKIENCWKSGAEIYGYFTLLFQASGFGKSRACQNLKNKAYVVYCCLRPTTHSGYPLRSFFANNLVSIFYNEIEAKKCFIGYFNMFISFLNDNPDITHEEFYKKFSNSFSGNKSSNEHYEEIKFEITELAKKYSFTDELIDLKDNKKEVIFVFDEVRSLFVDLTRSDKTFTSNYFEIRNVITKFNKTNKIFVLFLDTFSGLTNFMPTKFNEPSMRMQKFKSAEPIYLLPNWDVFVDIESIKTPKDSLIFENICSFGRPLWGSWCKAKKLNEKYKQVLDSQLVVIAKQKLVGGNLVDATNLNINQILAIAGCRIGTVKPLLISTAQDLVSKHMAICTYANPNEGIFKIEFPSEPILADVAASIMNETVKYQNQIESSVYKLIVNKLHSAISSSVIDQGEKGETITKFILLYSYDLSAQHLKTEGPLRYSSYVRVIDFVRNLYGNKAIEIIKEQLKNRAKILLDGFVRFNHFIRSPVSKDELNLVNLMKRCCAVQCHRYQKGVDFVIPVVLSYDKNSFNKMSAILVQTKLHQNVSKPKKEDIEKIMLSELDSPHLAIFMQLGNSNKPELTNLNFNLGNKAVIYSEGISTMTFPYLCSETINELNVFSTTQKQSFLVDKLDILIEEEIVFSSNNVKKK
ncbi:unnamed protein product, partial [Brachionus calyciflorus]